MLIRLAQYVYVISLFYKLSSAKIPDFIHPCDTIESECLTRAAQDAIPYFAQGIPEYGVPVMDPYITDVIKMDLTGISFTFTNGRVTGMRKCQMKEVKLLPKQERLIVDVRCNLTIKGPYKAKGRLLLFDINGDGDAKVKLTNIGFRIDSKFKQEKNDQGVEHFVLKSYKYETDFGGRVHFEFTNLFKNDPELTKTTVAFMNENWKILVNEFGKPILDYCVGLAAKYIEKFHAGAPARELYGPNVAWPLSAN